MSDREALGDGEEARVTADGDLACHSAENIDANRDLAFRESQPGIMSGLMLDVQVDWEDRRWPSPRFPGAPKMRRDRQKSELVLVRSKVKKALSLRGLAEGEERRGMAGRGD